MCLPPTPTPTPTPTTPVPPQVRAKRAETTQDPGPPLTHPTPPKAWAETKRVRPWILASPLPSTREFARTIMFDRSGFKMLLG